MKRRGRMPQDAPADFEGLITMTLFRNAVITNTRLDRECDDTVRMQHLKNLDSLANCFWSRLQHLSTTAIQHSSDSLLTAKRL